MSYEELVWTTGVEPASADSQSALVAERVRPPQLVGVVGIEPTRTWSQATRPTLSLDSDAAGESVRMPKFELCPHVLLNCQRTRKPKLRCGGSNFRTHLSRCRRAARGRISPDSRSTPAGRSRLWSATESNRVSPTLGAWFTATRESQLNAP